jgi:hypothetical protein
MIQEITVNIYKHDFKVFLYSDGDIRFAPLDFVKAVYGEDSFHFKMCLKNEERRPITLFESAIFLFEEAKTGNITAINLLLFAVAKGLRDVIIDSIDSEEFYSINL